MPLIDEITEIFERNNARPSAALLNALVERMSVHSKQSQSFDCPMCKARLYVNLELRLKRIVALDEEGKPMAGLSESVTGENAALLKELEESGIAQAFFETLERAMVGGTPRNPNRHLLDFIKGATRVRIARHLLRPLIQEFDGQIEIYAHNLIAAIVAGGQVRCFIPYPLLKGETVNRLTQNGTQITSTAEPMTSQRWRKSKFGYVEGSGAFFNELRKKSYGDFAVR